jgi:hypothetical protein
MITVSFILIVRISLDRMICRCDTDNVFGSDRCLLTAAPT